MVCSAFEEGFKMSNQLGTWMARRFFEAQSTHFVVTKATTN